MSDPISFIVVFVERTSRTTKEMEASELEQLTRPEARATAAFDAAELQHLLDKSRDDDLAVPHEPSAAPAALALGSIPPNDFDDVPGHVYTDEIPTSPRGVARGSARTPKARRSLKPLATPSSGSLLPWILVALSAAVVIALALWR